MVAYYYSIWIKIIFGILLIFNNNSKVFCQKINDGSFEYSWGSSVVMLHAASYLNDTSTTFIHKKGTRNLFWGDAAIYTEVNSIQASNFGWWPPAFVIDSSYALGLGYIDCAEPNNNCQFFKSLQGVRSSCISLFISTALDTSKEYLLSYYYRYNDSVFSIAKVNDSIEVGYSLDTVWQFSLSKNLPKKRIWENNQIFFKPQINANYINVCNRGLQKALPGENISGFVFIDDFRIWELLGGNKSSVLLCLGDSIRLKSRNGNLYSKWNNNLVAQYLYVKDTGIYTCYSYFDSTVIVDTFIVLFSPPSKSFFHGTRQICNSIPEEIKLPDSLVNYNKLWNTGDTSLKIISDNQGYYFCKTWNDVCPQIDSFWLQLHEFQTPEIISDTAYCDGDSIKLVLTSESLSLTKLWNTGDTSISIFVHDTGVYYCVSNFMNCFRIDSFIVKKQTKIPINLNPIGFICGTTPYRIDAYNSFYFNYLWNTGDTSRILVVYDTGFYKVTATNGICFNTDSCTVKKAQSPLINLPKDTIFCSTEGSIYLDAGNWPSIIWLPGGESTHGINVISAGVYSVKVKDLNGCESKDSINVMNNCSSAVYIPNAFTPNDDGVNEVFIPRARHFEYFELHIFNRIAEEIFNTTTEKGWDGNFMDKPCQTGIYIYVFKYRLNNKSGIQTAKGSFTLIR